ncbi:hypothetical protein RB195_007567 [Necator americanus]|uniref:Uncharacterized protein n=1 Tax=Necator americanus TaxID=51031 RepID=A0ABR1BXW7_NECAM
MVDFTPCIIDNAYDPRGIGFICVFFVSLCVIIGNAFYLITSARNKSKDTRRERPLLDSNEADQKEKSK